MRRQHKHISITIVQKSYIPSHTRTHVPSNTLYSFHSLENKLELKQENIYIYFSYQYIVIKMYILNAAFIFLFCYNCHMCTYVKPESLTIEHV